MALLHRLVRGGTCMEVRSAGHTRRLYVDGVLHTQYNPHMPLTGSVWDYLAFAGLFAPPAAIKRVLLLGLGGGAAIHLLRRYVHPGLIVSVEIDAAKLDLARRFFHIGGPDVRLVAADAQKWLSSYAGPPFDLIIDDLFGECSGIAQRAIPLHNSWTRGLLRVLARPGWLAVNTSPLRSLLSSPLANRPAYRRHFPAAFCLTDALTDNAVGCFCGLPTTSQRFRQRLSSTPGLRTARARQLMRFRVTTLWR